MPDFKPEIRAELTGLNLAPAREAEIVEELSQHLEDEYERAYSRGASEEEAKRAALEDLTTSDILNRELRHLERRAETPLPIGAQRRTNLIGDLLQDVRYGLRIMVKTRVLPLSRSLRWRSASAQTRPSSAWSMPFCFARFHSKIRSNWS